MTTTNLSGVPETMLWTLHNRASEAAHPDGVLHDPKCTEIYRSLTYDYERSFGKPEPSHGVRSAVFDRAVQNFVGRHPDAVIVNLGEGLETQRFRVKDDERVSWVCVDLPDAIAIRERFILPDARHQHVSASALDTRWFDAVPEGRPIFITAQGLLMYFTEHQVGELLTSIAHRWPHAEIMFDHIPRWLAAKTTSEKGWWKTKHYRVPPTPWGVNRSELLAKLGAWVGDVFIVKHDVYRFPRGARKLIYGLLTSISWVRERSPGITHVRLTGVPT